LKAQLPIQKLLERKIFEEKKRKTQQKICDGVIRLA